MNDKIVYQSVKMNIKERDEQIKNTYLTGNLSMREIGSRFNLHRLQVRRILLKQGITGPNCRDNRFDQWIDELKSLIKHNSKITNTQIAAQLNVSLVTVNKILKRAGIKRDKASIQSHLRKLSLHRGRVELTRDLLFELYVTEQKSTVEIGKQLNYSPAMIGFYLKRFGIDMRPRGWVPQRK